MCMTQYEMKYCLKQNVTLALLWTPHKAMVGPKSAQNKQMLFYFSLTYYEDYDCFTHRQFWDNFKNDHTTNFFLKLMLDPPMSLYLMVGLRGQTCCFNITACCKVPN